MLGHARSGDADIADSVRTLPLLQGRHEFIDPVQVVDLQQVDPLWSQAIQRTLEARRAAGEQAARREFSGEKQVRSNSKLREGVANERFAVTIGRSRVDHGAAQLTHPLDFRLNGVTSTGAELIRAQAYGRRRLAGTGNGFSQR